MKLFEGISPSDIPYIKKSTYSGRWDIEPPTSIKELPDIYNELTDEIDGGIYLEYHNKLKILNSFNKLTKIGTDLLFIGNPLLKYIDGFDNLKEVGGSIHIHTCDELIHISGFSMLDEVGIDISIESNQNLTYVTGFDNLTKIVGNLYVRDNSKLISISIPKTLIKSILFVDSGIYTMFGIIKHTSPEKFINDIRLIKDCIDKFDPEIHPDIVVQQIIENLELWGEPDNIEYIMKHILSKGDYWGYIPLSFNQYIDEQYHHLHNPKYKKTGVYSIAKVATGRYLGTF